jgi:hypothetical protein
MFQETNPEYINMGWINTKTRVLDSTLLQFQFNLMKVSLNEYNMLFWKTMNTFNDIMWVCLIMGLCICFVILVFSIVICVINRMFRKSAKIKPIFIDDAFDQPDTKTKTLINS